MVDSPSYKGILPWPGIGIRLTVIVKSVTGLGCVVGFALEKMKRGKKMTKIYQSDTTRNVHSLAPIDDHANE